MKDKIIVRLPNGNKLVAELYNYDGKHPEICAYIEDIQSMALQDVCLIRPSEVTENDIECFVWADEMTDSYTDKFDIKQYNWEDE